MNQVANVLAFVAFPWWSLRFEFFWVKQYLGVMATGEARALPDSNRGNALHESKVCLTIVSTRNNSAFKVFLHKIYIYMLLGHAFYSTLQFRKGWICTLSMLRNYLESWIHIPHIITLHLFGSTTLFFNRKYFQSKNILKNIWYFIVWLTHENYQ